MIHWSKAALFAAGFAAFTGAAWAEDVRLPAGLTSFGAAPSRTVQPTLFSAPGATFSQNDFSGGSLHAGTVPGYAFSFALSSSFAVDGGYKIDVAQRFDNYDGLKSPLLTAPSYAALANGGRYAGATWMPLPALSLRMGAAQSSNRLDRFSFDPAGAHLGLPMAFDGSQSRTLLAGLNWRPSSWLTLGLTGIHNEQSGTPFGLNPLGNLTASSRVTSDALDMAARLRLGDGWVTTASYSEGLTQLDRRATPASNDRAYSFAIAKHGVFGDDAVGFSLGRPTLGVLQSGFNMMASPGDLPQVFVANPSRVVAQAPETDLQLGYVTSFLDGALALQTNASYQMNYQGQNGAAAVSVLSRAKIKF